MMSLVLFQLPTKKWGGEHSCCHAWQSKERNPAVNLDGSVAMGEHSLAKGPFPLREWRLDALTKLSNEYWDGTQDNPRVKAKG